MHAFFDWLDLRLDYRRHLGSMRRRVLPQGPSWWYTSASCLLWLLLIECVTGFMLMATYSPSMASSWASVNFIDQSTAGRFLRGVHHYSSHAIIILFGLHLLRVLITGAYRAPRELVWITGLLLLPLIIVWTVTGNPLSASQKGIAQIQVEGNILAATPFVGPWLQRILFGGNDVGNLTLTRLYSLHVGLLPVMVGGLCLIHLHQVIKHSPYRQDVALDLSALPQTLPYWPYQSIRNMTSLSLIVGAIGVISWKWGAPLSAPADPELPFSPRPEWYFRWLFELRRHFTGDTEFIATLLVPSAFLGLFMVAPFLDRLLPAKADRTCRLILVAVCTFGWGWLTYTSFHRDWNDPEYLASQVQFEQWSERARQIARTEPMHPNGAVEFLRHDPQTQGPRLFARHCSSCHSMTDRNNTGIVATEPSAPNLFGLGTTEWISGFLDVVRIDSDDYFGKTAFRDHDMKQHIQSLFDESEIPSLKEKLEAAAIALAAESGHAPPDSTDVRRGRELLVGELRCIECHQFREHGSAGSAPDLTGYASAEWIKSLIADPRNARFYGERNDRMPSFAADSKHPEFNLLSELELDLLVKWLSGLGTSRVVDSAQESSFSEPAPASVDRTQTFAVKNDSAIVP